MCINFLETLEMQLKWPDVLRLQNTGVWNREYGVCMVMIGQSRSRPIKLLKFENSIILWRYPSSPLLVDYRKDKPAEFHFVYIRNEQLERITTKCVNRSAKTKQDRALL
jgi:hypothetical protein